MVGVAKSRLDGGIEEDAIFEGDEVDRLVSAMTSSRNKTEVNQIISGVTKGLRKSKSKTRSRKPSSSSDATTDTMSRPPPRTEIESMSPSKDTRATAIVSDDEGDDNGTRASTARSSKHWSESEDAGIHGFLHRMMFDESTEADTATGAANYDVDEESHSSESSEESSSEEYSEDGSLGSLSTDSENNSQLSDRDETTARDNFSTSSSRVKLDDSLLTEPTYDRSIDTEEDEDDDEATAKSSRAGLEVVAQLLSGAAEVTLDAKTIASSPMSLPQAGTVAKHIAEALAKTNSLERLVFLGPWNTSSGKDRSTKASKEEILQAILNDGLKQNTSVHTIVLENNSALDRYTGSVFGKLLRIQGRIQKLEIRQCGLRGSGWNSLLLGLQHSKSVKSLYLDSIPNLNENDLDGISLTLGFLQLESLRLCGVNLHLIDLDSLDVFFQAIQDTKSLKELDLSHNLLGGDASPHVLPLLARCLSGHRVRHESKSRNGMMQYAHPNFDHHIEKLTLVDCGITRSSCVKTLARALSKDPNPNKYYEDNAKPLVLTTLDVSQNRFGNPGAKIWQKWLESHSNIKHLGMLSCNVGAKYLRVLSDRLRYNNSFLKTIGLSSDVSLAILDSVSTMENVFGKTSTSTAT